MENQRLAVNCFVDFVQTVKVQTSPVCRILAMDVADACSEEVYAESCDFSTFLRISEFAVGSNAVFCSADTADFALNRNAYAVSQSDDFLGLSTFSSKSKWEPSNITDV